MKIQKIFLTIFILIVFQFTNANAFPIHILDLIYFENPATLNRVKHCEINLADHYWMTLTYGW
jgi:hypothetical protein